MKKCALTTIIALVLAVTLAACSNAPSEPSAASASETLNNEITETPSQESASELPSPDNTTVPSEQEEAVLDLSAVHAAYLSFLESNKENILAYNWQTEKSGASVSAAHKRVMFCDITGDQIPELFCFSVSTPYEADLNIYTFENGGTVLIHSEKKLDHQYGGGVTYCLFTAKTDNLFYIYKSVDGEPWIYSFTQYESTDDGTLTAKQILTHKKEPSDDYSSTIHTYTQDSVEIAASDYESRVDAIMGEMDSVLIWSGSEDEPIMDKATEAFSLAMSYENAVVFLKNNLDNPRDANTPFSKELAQAYMITHMLERWGEYATADIVNNPERFEIGFFEASDVMEDGQPVYLIDYSVIRIGGGVILVFADGSVIDSLDPQFVKRCEHFGFDVSDWAL